MDTQPKPTNDESAILGPSIDVFRGVYGALFGMAVTLTIFVTIFGIDVAIENINPQGVESSFLDRVLAKAESWVAPLIGCIFIGFYSGWATYAPAGNGKHFDFGYTLAIIFFSSLLLLCVASAVIDQPKPTKGSPVNPLVMFGATLPSLFVTIALTLWRMRKPSKDHSSCPVVENS